MEGKIPLDVFIIDDMPTIEGRKDKSRIELIQIYLKQKASTGIIGKIDSNYNNPNLTAISGKFHLVLCNKNYFDKNEMDLVASGFRGFPFYLYLITQQDQNKYLTKLKEYGFNLSGTIIGILDKEIYRCLDEVLKLYNQKQ